MTSTGSRSLRIRKTKYSPLQEEIVQGRWDSKMKSSVKEVFKFGKSKKQDVAADIVALEDCTTKEDPSFDDGIDDLAFILNASERCSVLSIVHPGLNNAPATSTATAAATTNKKRKSVASKVKKIFNKLFTKNPKYSKLEEVSTATTRRHQVVSPGQKPVVNTPITISVDARASPLIKDAIYRLYGV